MSRLIMDKETITQTLEKLELEEDMLKFEIEKRTVLNVSDNESVTVHVFSDHSYLDKGREKRLYRVIWDHIIWDDSLCETIEYANVTLVPIKHKKFKIDNIEFPNEVK